MLDFKRITRVLLNRLLSIDLIRFRHRGGAPRVDLYHGEHEQGEVTPSQKLEGKLDIHRALSTVITSDYIAHPGATEESNVEQEVATC
jgi:hypothetical protein